MAATGSLGQRIAVWLAALLALAAAPAWAAVEIQARIDKNELGLGESASLEVVVRGAMTAVGEPDLAVPDGVEVLGSGRTQSFSWINGKSTVETVFRYEVAPRAPGQYRLGPIRVRVGNQTFMSPPLVITAVEGAARERAATPRGQAPASLVVDVMPASPYVGQPALLRVRLVQRAPLAEDPRYTPPPTPGFWAERPSEPESYYGDPGVLVTETRTRLYPLATGVQRVGEAAAQLTVQQPGSSLDPLQWFRGGLPRRPFNVRSAPVDVRVRPLPPGAPEGFDGAVGSFTVAFAVDRGRTTIDAPITARLDVRGAGNLPLARPPAFAPRGFEVLASTLQDSAAAAGTLSGARRRFQWTLLPQATGEQPLAAPRFVWFDPTAGTYRSVEPPGVLVHVGPAPPGRAPAAAAFPSIFAEHPLDPFARPALPAGLALAGLAFGGALVLARRGRAAAPSAGDSDVATMRSALAAREPAAFWVAAERAAEWLAARGVDVAAPRRAIAEVRYARAAVNPVPVRSALDQALAAHAPRTRGPWATRVAAGALGLLAVVAVVLSIPAPGPAPPYRRAQAADARARAGTVDAARAEWMRLWHDGSRSPGLAARLAWADLRTGDMGGAASWVLRGEARGVREPGLAWVRGQVRDAGGLVGAGTLHLPVRRLEWGIAAMLAAALVPPLWPRRVQAGLVALVALACAAAWPIESWRIGQVERVVLRQPATLEGAGLQLEPGQVVTLLESRGPKARVLAGRGAAGWVATESLTRVEALQ